MNELILGIGMTNSWVEPVLVIVFAICAVAVITAIARS